MMPVIHNMPCHSVAFQLSDIHGHVIYSLAVMALNDMIIKGTDNTDADVGLI